MMYRGLVGLLSLVLRLYFRHVEVVGLHRIPAEGPVIFVLNHPNGLVDPLFILCYAPRHVSFLAKTPIFKMPVIGWIARAIDAIPVYRVQDEGGGAGTLQKNMKTFDRARKVLSEGKSIALFPEGVSHSDSRLKPLKSGAARIALGSGLEDLRIVPAGLFYTSKGTFRSSALLYFGEPFGLPPVAEIGTPADPDRQVVRALTERMREALDEVTLQAKHPSFLHVVERAEAIFSSAAGDRKLPGQGRLRRRFLLARQFMIRYERLREEAPELLGALERRIADFEADLAREGLRLEDILPAEAGQLTAIIQGAVFATLRLVALPLVLVGMVTHYAAYRLIGFLSYRIAKQDFDLVSTIKVLGAMAIFPLFWIGIAAGVGACAGWLAGLTSLVVVPASGYVALRFMEEVQADLRAARALVLLLRRRERYVELRREQVAIRDAILALERG
jgi:glycerol-3-phosphate O-acyltransferase / dihydroxyacetone phosphate acyltransferase